MIRWILPTISFISLVVLSLLLNLTSPGSIGPFGILIVFVFIYLSSLGVVTFLIFWFSKLLSFVSKVFVFRKPIRAISLRHSYWYASIISIAPVIVVGLESVGAVGGGEFLLVLLFVSIGCVYVSRRIY